MNEDLKQANKNIVKWLNPFEIIELEDEKLDDNEQKLRANATEAYYKGYFEKKLKLVTLQILREMGEKAGPDTIWSYRGALYFADLIKTWFDEQVMVAKSYRQPKDKPRPAGEVITPVEED